MLTIRRANDRGGANHGWLRTQHTFSFANYYDPAHMGFGPLRVINEDRVAGGEGFPTHPHRDMEILTYVLDGALEHRDSMGNGSVIYPGEVQRMSAGTGVTHSEQNHSPADDVHFLQIWIVPDTQRLAPSYEQRAYPVEERTGALRLVASRDGRDGSVTVHQDVALYAALLDGEDRAHHVLAPGRRGWIHVARGTVDVNGTRANAGDGIAVQDTADIVLSGAQQAEILLFDLAQS